MEVEAGCLKDISTKKKKKKKKKESQVKMKYIDHE